MTESDPGGGLRDSPSELPTRSTRGVGAIRRASPALRAVPRPVAA